MTGARLTRTAARGPGQPGGPGAGPRGGGAGCPPGVQGAVLADRGEAVADGRHAETRRVSGVLDLEHRLARVGEGKQLGAAAQPDALLVDREVEVRGQRGHLCDVADQAGGEAQGAGQPGRPAVEDQLVVEVEREARSGGRTRRRRRGPPRRNPCPGRAGTGRPGRDAAGPSRRTSTQRLPGRPATPPRTPPGSGRRPGRSRRTSRPARDRSTAGPAAAARPSRQRSPGPGRGGRRRPRRWCRPAR